MWAQPLWVQNCVCLFFLNLFLKWQRQWCHDGREEQREIRGGKWDESQTTVISQARCQHRANSPACQSEMFLAAKQSQTCQRCSRYWIRAGTSPRIILVLLLAFPFSDDGQEGKTGYKLQKPWIRVQIASWWENVTHGIKKIHLKHNLSLFSSLIRTRTRVYLQQSRGCLLYSHDQLHKLLRCICSSTCFQSTQCFHNSRLWLLSCRKNLSRDWETQAHLADSPQKLDWKNKKISTLDVEELTLPASIIIQSFTMLWGTEVQLMSRVLAGRICWGRLQGNSPAANFSDCLTKCESLTLPRRCCVRVTGDLCDFNYPLWKPINEMWRPME